MVKIREDIVLGQCSHVGLARTENQDFFGFWESDDDRAFDVKGRLVVVCDGMGGHAGGEIASRLAVQTIIKVYEQDQSGNVQDALRRAIEAANRAIYLEGQRETKLKGMGSTCTALVHRRDMVYFGQVGDSRGYLIRGGHIKQMTKDHSLVQQLVDEGLLDKSEMESHPDKNVILRSLGVKPEVEVDVSYLPAMKDDIFLLCSDGLSGPVSEAEMLSLINASPGDLKKASASMIDLANKYGGYDNITVQLLKVVRTDTATTDKTVQGSVTASFTSDQVAESIAKAKAEAAARKSGGAPAAPAAKKPQLTAEAPIPQMPGSPPAKADRGETPTTAISMPVPDLGAAAAPAAAPAPRAAAPAPSGGGSGFGMLVLGLFLGLGVGAAGTFLGLNKIGMISNRTSDDSKERATDYEKKVETVKAAAHSSAKTDKAVIARADAEVAKAKEAMAGKYYGEAYARYFAAFQLYEYAATGK